MKTQGEIESEISESMGCFVREYMGRGPADIRTHLVGDLVVVRLSGVLTAVEQHLVRTFQAEKSRDLLKQVRRQLIEIARPALVATIEDITGVSMLTVYHDISTSTDEEVVLFSLAEAPPLLDSAKNEFTNLRHANDLRRNAKLRREPAGLALVTAR